MPQTPPPARIETDADLIARVGRGDAGALSVLMERHHSGLLRLLHRVLGRRDGAQDLLQELWLKLWTHGRRYDSGRGAFGPWVKRLAVNLAIDEQRRRRSGMGATVALDGVAETLVDPAPGPALQVERETERARLGRAIDSLARRQRDAVLLTYQGALSAAETARTLGISVPAVEALLVRARRTLRHRLARPGTQP